VTNVAVNADTFYNQIQKICTSPAGCIGKSLAWSTIAAERDACRLSGDDNHWCAKELFALKSAISKNGDVVPEMATMCTPCTRRYEYFPKYKIDTYCLVRSGKTIALVSTTKDRHSSIEVFIVVINSLLHSTRLDRFRRHLPVQIWIHPCPGDYQNHYFSQSEFFKAHAPMLAVIFSPVSSQMLDAV
jgi:hypothetical protein